MPITKFRAQTKIHIHEYQGYFQVELTLAKKGDEFNCETNQTSNTLVEDDGVVLDSSFGKKKISFETLGRLVASGSITQI